MKCTMWHHMHHNMVTIWHACWKLENLSFTSHLITWSLFDKNGFCRKGKVSWASVPLRHYDVRHLCGAGETRFVMSCRNTNTRKEKYKSISHTNILLLKTRTTPMCLRIVEDSKTKSIIFRKAEAPTALFDVNTKDWLRCISVKSTKNLSSNSIQGKLVSFPGLLLLRLCA